MHLFLIPDFAPKSAWKPTKWKDDNDAPTSEMADEHVSTYISLKNISLFYEREMSKNIVFSKHLKISYYVKNDSFFPLKR